MNSIASWPSISARIVRGYRVASGLNGDLRFPGGTLRMQFPHFLARGLDLSAFHPGTLNVSIAPRSFHVMRARHTFRQVRWHSSEPAEDFSFFDCLLLRDDASATAGFIYFPHPETKPEHTQQPDVIELLLPWIDGLKYDDEICVGIPADQMTIQ